MGRRPLPAQVIQLRGNARKLTREQIEARRDHARPASGVAPDDLTRHEAAVWRAHAGELARLGILTVLDEHSFRLLVVTPGAIALEALEALRPAKSDGTPDRRRKDLAVIVPDRKYGGVKRHPALSVFFQAVKEYRAGCSVFGLTPSSRVSLRTAPPELEDDDADLFE